MQLDSFSFDQHRLECLNAEAMERGRAIQQDGVIADDFFENIPDYGVLLLHQFFGLFDRGAMATLLEPVVDEGFEQLERHLLGQATLMELKLRTDYNDRAAGVIDAFSEQILPEAALLALQSVGKRFERAVIGATQHASAPAVIKQSIHGLLQHALFIAHDDIGSVQFDEFLEPVVPVDHAAVEIIEIGSGETAAVERNQRAQLGRNHGDDVQNHPFGLVARFAEALDDTEAFGVLQLLLRRSLRLHLFADILTERFDIDLFEELFDAFGAH